jgi:hypothetical protein
MSIRKITALLSAVALAVAHGCSGQARGGDSESHFMRCSDGAKCLVLASSLVYIPACPAGADPAADSCDNVVRDGGS